MTDEEYVRSVWEWVDVRLAEPFEGIAKGKWTVRIPLLPFSQIGFDTDTEAWAAAAEFTRERLEQIRQVENEVATMADMCEFSRNLLKINADYVEAVRDLCCNSRILAREQAALAGLKQGMK